MHTWHEWLKIQLKCFLCKYSTKRLNVHIVTCLLKQSPSVSFAVTNADFFKCAKSLSQRWSLKFICSLQDLEVYKLYAVFYLSNLHVDLYRRFLITALHVGTLILTVTWLGPQNSGTHNKALMASYKCL